MTLYALCIVIPTYNESENVAPLLTALQAALGSIRYEVIFVDDDSPDGTAEAARAAAGERANIRVMERVGRRGLASACIEGMLATSAPFIAVMDADMQHDERLLPQMLEKITDGDLDLVVGSRNMAGGSMGGMVRRRALLSQLGRRLCRVDRLSDPMSGFFMIRRTAFASLVHRLSGVGFKILLDTVLSAGGRLRIAEIPYHFRSRKHGESKLDVVEGFAYLELLLDKALRGVIPARFVIYCAVGAVGVGIHLLLLWCFLRAAGLTFARAQTITTVLVMMLNYAMNNSITWRDRRRRGWEFWTGMSSYILACALGLAVNVAVSSEAAHRGVPWAVAGVTGLMFSAVWNYGATSVLTWRYRRKRNESKRHVAESDEAAVPAHSMKSRV